MAIARRNRRKIREKTTTTKKKKRKKKYIYLHKEIMKQLSPLVESIYSFILLHLFIYFQFYILIVKFLIREVNHSKSGIYRFRSI